MGCIRAHRVANPEKFPVSDVVRKLYPIYEGDREYDEACYGTPPSLRQ